MHSFIHEYDKFLVSMIEPNIENGPWIAGGAPLDWYQGRYVDKNDIDVFFKDEEQYNKLVLRFQDFQQKFMNQTTGNYIFLDGIITTGNARTYKLNTSFSRKQLSQLNLSLFSQISTPTVDNKISVQPNFTDNSNFSSITIQFINKHYFKNAVELINSFDISVAQIATDGNTIVMGKNTEKDIKNKVLRFENGIKPTSLKRIMKYWVYGYEPTVELLDTIKNLSHMDWDYEYEKTY